MQENRLSARTDPPTREDTMAKIPNDLVVPAQFYGLKTVVTVMLDQWVSIQKDPAGALEAQCQKEAQPCVTA